MPFMQAFVERLNTRFNSTNIAYVEESLLAPGQNVADAAVASSKGPAAIDATQAEKDYVNKFAPVDLESLRKILHWAVVQNPRVPVQFLWVPSADGGYHIKFWNVAATGSSKGGISVLIEGPTLATVLDEYHG